MAYVVLVVIGLGGGMLVSGGLVALLMALSMLARYAAITGSADQILLYENCVIAGTIGGNVFQIFNIRLPIGQWGLALYGIFAGIFLGGWILALAEMADIFPILFRRIKLETGMGMLVLSIAAGKICGSLIFFMKGWG